MLKFEIGVKTLKVSQVVVAEVMPTKRRSRKRNRSSPQVPSASKKHQSLKSAVACDLQEADESLETNTQTEIESADIVKQSGLGAESDMNVTIDSTMAEVTSTPISKIREQTGVNLDGRLKLTVLSGPVLFINSNIFISGINTKSILYSNIMLLLDLNGTTTCFELEDTRSM